jgi:hypothetical protein
LLYIQRGNFAVTVKTETYIHHGTKAYMDSGFVFTMHDKTHGAFFNLGQSRTKLSVNRGTKVLQEVLPKFQIYTSHTNLAAEALKVALHGCLTVEECEWQYECSDEAVILEAFECVQKCINALAMCNKHVFAEVSPVETIDSNENAVADVVGYMDCILDAHFHKVLKSIERLRMERQNGHTPVVNVNGDTDDESSSNGVDAESVNAEHVQEQNASNDTVVQVTKLP